MRRLKCYALSHGDTWEAICVDLDISVAGGSYAEVRQELERAITTYLEAVAEEPLSEQRRLLNRRAPLMLRARLALMMLIYRLRHNGDHDKTTGFSIPCHA